MDFYQIKERHVKKDFIEIYPDFKVCRSKDLMIRGKSFYAIWDDQKGLWSTDEYDVQRLVDKELMEYKNNMKDKTECSLYVKLMSDFSSRSWGDFRNYLSHLSDNAHQLDTKLTFSNTDIKKKDYVSRKLNYPLEKGKLEAFDELIGTLYEPSERAKIEWAIGSIVSGDSIDIQKFIVLYGEAGAGKSTILNVIQKLFYGYHAAFDAKALTGSNSTFATEAFKFNPLVAIQHDGDLSKIEDNTKLNSIVSHEEMSIRELYKPSYMARFNCFLFMGTNKPVKITDAKSGIIRRLIDVKPSGKLFPPKKYQSLISQIDFELGAIAYHCLEVYRSMGKNYYASYRPLDMILQTDIFFNFVESNYFLFVEQDGVTLNQAYQMYKEYCDDSMIEFKIPKHKFREELKNYFSEFQERIRIDGLQTRSYYSGFLTSKFKSTSPKIEEHQNKLVLDNTESLIDLEFATCKAQYATIQETPIRKWSEIKSVLADLKTTKLHYVQIPENHIVIDFDLLDENGNKSMGLNVEAASKWPSTYAEFSKSGCGIHLHYIYDGDIKKISRIHSEGIEIKVFTGDSSLRRKLTKCNNIPITTINSGIPLRGETMINLDVVKSEKSIRDMIKRNFNKEIHPGTKPSIDFINKILDDAYNSGIPYDITDMRPKILAFANNSTNQADYCIKLVNKMKFKSDEKEQLMLEYKEDELVFFDVEVFPNLFVLVWKPAKKSIVKMINPLPLQIEDILKFKLIGFNCRRYDNHILYARYIGYDNAQLFTLSQRIIAGSPNCMFSEAYNISYTDVYDFASAGNKKSLKKFEIELDIHHKELGFKWEEPVPKNLWNMVADYCANDVIATEIVFDHLVGDFTARKILAEISGLSTNDTTNAHTTKLIFGNDPKPQEKAIYTDLSIMFPGYKFDKGISTYRGEETGEGGYVYAEPGMYKNVALMDIEAMHPTNIEQLNLFGPYTEKFSEIKRARLAIKHKDYDSARKMLGGELAKYLEDESKSKDLSNALKTAINSVYGLTSAKFENKFRDPRNIDNIVAKRGALFMIDLKHAVQEQGFVVAHIKTDSIKIPDATPEIIKFVVDYGRLYGYEFEHEVTYEKMCLVNDSVYIAKTEDGTWSAVGAQFAHPYVYKTCFTKEKVYFNEMREVKSVSTAIYLDMNESLENGDHDYHFVGKVGAFTPIKSGCGGGILLREKEGKYNAISGTKGYSWMESEMVKILGREEDIDYSYYYALVNDAIETISKFGDFEWFVSDDKIEYKDKNHPPWSVPCGDTTYKDCYECKNYDNPKEIDKCKLKYNILPF